MKLIVLLFGGGAVLALAALHFLQKWAEARAQANLGEQRLDEQTDVNKIHNRIDSDPAFRERVRREFDGS